MVDLNLIRVFAVIIEEGSVTAAAERLKMSQPSVTQALNRLRQATGDQLFEREGRGITPTRAALQLYEEVGRLPAMADSAVSALHRFDPMAARTTFRIALTDLGQTVFLPGLVSGLAETAPHCSLDVVNLNTTTAVDDLVSGQLDLAVSSTPLRGAVRPAVIRSDHYCCVSAKGRFGDRTPSLEDLTSLPRVVVRDSTGHTLVESLLPPPADGSLHVSGFSAIPGVLEVSRLIAFVPEAVTKDWAARWDFEVRSLPPDQFSSTVRAHSAIDAPTAATAWFVDWAADTMRLAH
ncbi:MAG TPA: LysR family transcriptional regulator [Microbacterium sp.]|uniref:LysR family transcriptional regulator n=1 Tax=Microbacterium sp. TaxID=51671 RepID=UPI002B45E988|nr:LysR family transcriptional regulator [Microbacterium sp.]HKT56335.1 LysR family transcriptional regulator [Microbacterium sp.]